MCRADPADILLYHQWYGSLSGVAWSSVELEPEVVVWQLGEPYTRQLQGKLRELRFHLGQEGDAVRITY